MNEKEKRVSINLRLMPDVLKTIDERAAAANLTRTEYIVRCCTSDESTDKRLGWLTRAASKSDRDHEWERSYIKINVCLTVTVLMIVCAVGAVLVSHALK